MKQPPKSTHQEHIESSMCDLCTSGGRDPGQSSRRLKIWEIKTSCHCLICGTCLTMAELRKIAVKARLFISDDATGYEIHSHFVRGSERQGPIAKLVHRTLDRKYRTAVESSRRCKSDDALTRYWDKAIAKGDIPGPFWAVMTHPLITDDLAVRVFGEVHMLSHLQGSSNRADKRRLGALEQENAGLSDALASEAAAAQRRLQDRDEQVETLRRQLSESESRRRRVEAAKAKLVHERELESREEQCSRIDDLEAALAQRQAAMERVETKFAEQSTALEEAHAEAERLRASVAELEEECDALAALLKKDMTSLPEDSISPCQSFDLSGQCIVYIGGRSSLAVHFRSLVERSNGRFIHHDGGIEESIRRLSGLLSQGDAVLCPIDCVSHSACIRAKQFCKQTARAFVPLRTSGLSSFVSGLRQLADPGKTLLLHTRE